MSTTQWIIGLLVAAAFSGTMGAAITLLVTHRRNKRQPVVHTKEIIHIFRKNKDFEKLEAKLLVKDGPLENAPVRSVDYLSLVRIKVTNKGNQDIEEFIFGVTLKGSNKVVDIRMSAPDRSHSMTIDFPDAADESFVNKPDFTLKPFNRGETYLVDIYFSYEGTPGEIELSSAHSTKFVEDSETRRVILVKNSSLMIGSWLLSLILGAFGWWAGAWLAKSPEQDEKNRQTLLRLEKEMQRMEQQTRELQASPSPTPQPSK